ncbi:trbC/VIRB2 family protein [Anaplasma phagocytophilum str. CR1007]|nr:type VI secretion protein [Anaplasma phagocytophilum str. HZ2]AGR80291.1 type VI secretion protein [Anaplasma phagocytophilum str. JM]AGR81545.1 type VI secretion protein [Anaplasma phagocytophilum str. Dog2]KJV59396.1 trbC/VIRB2 family protein [Anaplasma phagocytophilum str. NCH-1]KJV60620.1 trbC/VIRB2 family protein [Anaplasma phagocytophilum str. Webster]KJV82859.1 trbC/VIRB2 family protein [Anaplasma phagocytophilum str. HGE2]KJV86783.1 trbC/VIRB2 family protein [Anaplasma phagocytophi
MRGDFMDTQGRAIAEDRRSFARTFFNKKVFFLIIQGSLFFVLLLILDEAYAGVAESNLFPAVAQHGSATNEDVTSKVICNVVKFVRGIGLPIMTGVILGSSVMAIFGRLAWPAIAALVIFTAVFFGAEKVISKFTDGISVMQTGNCDTI